MSERQLIKEKCKGGVGKLGHLSDGLLVLPDGEQIALEIELSTNSKHRTERIVRSYASKIEIKEVWYFCYAETLTFLRELVAKWSYIKIIDLESFLAGDSGG